MKESLTSLLDRFYPPFKRFMPVETFRYAACGGGNTLIGLFFYFIGYKYIFGKKVFDFGFFAFKPQNAALFLSCSITFIVGFLLSKYIVFTGSNMKGRIQLFRYSLTFSFNLTVNYILLNLLVEVLKLNWLGSQLFTTCVVIGVSYLGQKHFTFRTKAS